MQRVEAQYRLVCRAVDKSRDLINLEFFKKIVYQWSYQNLKWSLIEMRGISNESTNDAENDENVVLKAKPYHVDELVLHSKKCYKCDAVNQVTARSLSHSCQNCSAVNCFQCKVNLNSIHVKFKWLIKLKLNSTLFCLSENSLECVRWRGSCRTTRAGLN